MHEIITVNTDNRKTEGPASKSPSICISIMCRQGLATVEMDLIATEMLAFPSKASRYQNNSNRTIAKTTPI